MKLSRGCLVLGCILLGLSTVGCFKKSPVIRFILPDDYQGFFRVYEDAATGQFLHVIDGEIRVIVPVNGLVPVKNYDLFQRWIRYKAEYASGDELSHYGEDPTAVAPFFSLGEDLDLGAFFLVGPEDRYEEHEKGLVFSELELGSVHPSHHANPPPQP